MGVCVFFSMLVLKFIRLIVILNVDVGVMWVV